MRQLRLLKQGVWYKIRTRINNREPLFRYAAALAVFAGVFRETRLRFVFELRALNDRQPGQFFRTHHVFHAS
jgi:hypothetical protein